MPSPPAAPAFELVLLGTFRASVDGREVPAERWERRPSKALVKLLALAPSRELHREQILDRLWPDVDPAAASNRLNKALHGARRALEPELAAGGESRFLRRDADRLELVVEAEAVDVLRFESAVRHARASGIPGDFLAARAVYGGDLLPEDPYEDWVVPARQRLATIYDDLLFDLAEAARDADDLDAAIGALEELVTRAPAREDGHRRLMEWHWRAGKRDRALRQFEACVRSLERAVDASPSAETVELQRRIAAGDAPDEGAESPPRAVTTPGADGAAMVLAVLPFVCEGRDPARSEQPIDYIADGLTEGLIQGLAELPALRVIARSSAFRFVETTFDVDEIGRRLGASGVVCGRIRTGGDRVRISVEMIRVADRTRLWGHTFERPVDELAWVQSELLRAVLDEVASSVGERARPVASRRERRLRSSTPQAHRDYLRGRFFWNKRNDDALRRAIRCFQSALDDDPTYVGAHVGLADCYSLQSLYGLAPPGRTMPRAKAAAERALAIDADCAEAYASLGYVQLYYDWDFVGAEQRFRAALELSANYATAHHWYHELLTALGRVDEQARRIRIAEELDPLSAIIKAEVGWGCYFARRFELAEQHLHEALDLDPQLAVAHLLLGLTALALDREARANELLASLERAVELGGERFPLAVAALGHARGLLGDPAGAESALNELAAQAERGFVSRYYEAPIHAALGATDAAVAALAAGVDERCDRVVYLARDPVFDGLRDEPAFGALLRTIGLGAARASP